VDQEVLASLERSQNKKSSWWSFVLVLGISLLLFVGAGRMDKSFLWLLIPILLFHELGHYVAMRVFGYRNVKMFFIPFLGAAVTGKHYNVPGWKKAVVALMGPLPGIVVGAGLGVGGLVFHQTKVTEAAMMMIVLNAFNLLPFLPLDGGWVVHAVLFCRHPLLDVGFRLAAVLGVLGLSLLLHDKLYLLGIPMLIGLPAVWRAARAAQRLREKGEIATSPDGASIPPEAVKPIVAELTTGRQVRPPTNILAMQVTNVFETLNARPPGVLATLGLLGVHGGSFLAAMVFLIVLMVGRHGFPWNRFAPTPTSVVETTPTCSYTSGSTRDWHGPEAPSNPRGLPAIIIASYSGQGTARAQFDFLPTELPPSATLRLFGQTLILVLPIQNHEVIERWVDRLKQQTDDVIVGREFYFLNVRLSCQAPDEKEAKYLQEELRLYSHSQNQMIMPPWSAAWQKLSEADRERFRKARRTLNRCDNIRSEAIRNPEVQAARNLLTGQENPIDNGPKAFETFERLRDAEEQRLLSNLAKEDEKTIDHAMLDLCKRHLKLMKESSKFDGEEEDESTPDAKAWAKQIAALNKEMAERMGALPLRDDKPEPGSNLESGHPGQVSRKDLTLSIDRVTFGDVTRGLPAFAEWLSRRGCRKVEYTITVRNFPMGKQGPLK
jgi:Zn-dependent protease